MDHMCGYKLGVNMKKKRSCMSRRARKVSKNFHVYTCLPTPTQSMGSLNNEECPDSRDRMAGLDGLTSENKLKVKLKLGGVTHTIHTKPTTDVHGTASTFTGSSRYVDGPPSRHRSLSQFCKGSNFSHSSDKSKSYGIWGKDVPETGLSFGKGHSTRGKIFGDITSMSETCNSDIIRKSKRVPKRRVLDVDFSGDSNEDEELRYLGRLNATSIAVHDEDVDDEKNKTGQRIYEDKSYMEEEPLSYHEHGYHSKIEKEQYSSFIDGRKESIPTTRNRALQSGKDVLSASGTSILEFPDGLPPAQPRKQKEKLSEVEQQLKRTEAAQRRRIQSEKAAREAEAEAIRKILGQESGRKKREEKMKRQLDELAQGRAAKSQTLASNTIRIVIGPNGTVVTFSNDIGLPKILNSVPCSYPPPREKCAGPNCGNAYKYRDSKSKLPLCSLHCYKAIHGKGQPLIAC